MRTSLRITVQSCLVLAAFLVCNSLSAFGQGANPFFTPPTFSGKGQALSAEVNGDGKADLLFFDGTVLLGKGDGTFTTGTPWRSTASPNPTANQFAIADFNGDGKQDIFIVGPLNVLSVMLGNGDGTFQAPKTTSIATPATAFLVGDLNGDGKPDVLAQLNGGIFAYLGKGDGTFAAGITSNALSPGIPNAAFADFNGDGKLDLFVPESGIQLGKGDGMFQTLIPFPAGALSGSDTLGDFDGDGKVDVLATGGSPTGFQVLFGNGDGTFHAGTTQTLPVNSGLLNLVAVDLNGDGKADVVGSTGAVAAVQVFIGKGDGNFTIGDCYNAPAGVSGTGAANMVAADFNGDGKKDVAAFNTMLLGKGDGTFLGDEAVPGITGGGVTGDFNGDGHPDLALITSGTTNNTNNTMNLNIWLNDGKPNLTLAHTYTITIPSPGADISGEVVISAAVDVNGDGKTDLVGYLWDGAGLNALVLLGHGDGSFGAQILSVISNGSVNGNSSVSVAVGDLNNDGKPDIVAPTFGTFGGALSIVLGNGDGTFGAPSTPFVGTPGFGLTLGDFNNDKKLDVILETSNGLGVLLGNGDGTFQPTTFVQSNICCGNILSGDFNGDGNLDLMIATAGYQILAGKGDGTFTAMPAVTDSLGAFSGTQVADFNGDGHLDVLGQFSTQSGSPLGLILGKGDGTFSAPFDYSVSGIPAVADFDGDGKPDVALLGTTQLVWLFNNGTAVTPPPPTGPDFSVGSGSGSGTATVTAGSTATYPLSLAGSGGFTGTVALTCSVAPAGPGCSVSPSSVMVTGSAAATATVSVTTTARSVGLPVGDSNQRDSSRRILWIFGALFAAAGIIRSLATAQMRPRRFSWTLATACGATLLLAATLISGCGGGSNSPTGSTGSSGTTAGSYTVTVIAQSGSVSHRTNLTLTVQ